MSLAAALIYWVIIAIWLAVLATVGFAFYRNPKTFGTTRLLLTVVAVDTTRNIIENLYFGVYFGGQYGLFPKHVVGVLGLPYLLILPKVMNVIAATFVLGLLLMRWLPEALRERRMAELRVSQSSSALQQEMEEHRRLFETSSDLIIVADCDHVIQRISNSSLPILGRRPEEMVGRHGGEFIADKHFARLQEALQQARTGLPIPPVEADFLHGDGRPVTIALAGVWSEKAQRFFLIGRDMTERKAAEQRLRYLAHFDQLTGLPNRTRMIMDLDEKLATRSHGRPADLAVALLDLDGFKDFNDTLGNSTGDKLLIIFAQRLTEAVGDDGAVCRFGGDEFLVTIPDRSDAEEIERIVAFAQERIQEPVELDGHRLFLSASAGIAIAPAGPVETDMLISSADLALRDAKAAGSGKFRRFAPEMRTRAEARQSLETELRRACKQCEFELFFQPQVRLRDDAIVGAEALLRWNHPERGILAPADFIDALAQSPVALEVGQWILQTACASSASWRLAGLSPVRVGVNLFPVHFHEGALVADVVAALASSGLPAEALELELTENIAFGRDEEILPTLQALRNRGVGLAFDDFGTGYASLSYLTRYPLTRLKIDRSFVSQISDRPSLEETAIVRSIISMGHNLGLQVVAEGVETEEQATYLRSRKCEEAQGYLYSKPLPPDEFVSFLRTGRMVRPEFRGVGAPANSRTGA